MDIKNYFELQSIIIFKYPISCVGVEISEAVTEVTASLTQLTSQNKKRCCVHSQHRFCLIKT